MYNSETFSSSVIRGFESFSSKLDTGYISTQLIEKQ